MNENWYVLTGGPCAGKTTTINELAKRGYPVVAEAARLIIEEELAQGTTIGEIVSHEDWLQAVVRRAVEMQKSVNENERVFFDRGIPDSIAYYRLGGKEQDEVLKAALDGVKYRKIFLLDLVDFSNDPARSETLEEARTLHQYIADAYQGLGYEIVRVPVMPVEKRVDYILAHLA
ncbi:MAG: hypothetical protein JWM46_776 [Candidatus Kaiserbacteria bacterium]|nr:hypothetical protein [Candidatus Kaiserbacteria bacterium]